MLSGELSQGIITSKKTHTDNFTTVERFRAVDLKSTDISYVQYATASSTRPYGRTIEARTAADLAAGLTQVDIQKLAPGDEVTLEAGEAIASLKTPCGLTTYGKIVALESNPTPVTQYCFCENLEAASGDGSKIICRIIDRLIEY